MISLYMGEKPVDEKYVGVKYMGDCGWRCDSQFVAKTAVHGCERQILVSIVFDGKLR